MDTHHGYCGKRRGVRATACIPWREREVTDVHTPIQQLPMADFLRILALTRRQRTIPRPISPIDGETFEDVEEEARVHAITY